MIFETKAVLLLLSCHYIIFSEIIIKVIDCILIKNYNYENYLNDFVLSLHVFNVERPYNTLFYLTLT